MQLIRIFRRNERKCELSISLNVLSKFNAYYMIKAITSILSQPVFEIRFKAYCFSLIHVNMSKFLLFQQRPLKHCLCVSLRRDAHWKCLILTLLICGCLIAIAWCRLTVVTKVVVLYDRYLSQTEINTGSPCADGYIYIPVAFVILIYLVYLVECWHCHTRIELKHKVDVQTVYYKIRQMRESFPIVWWKAMCYHYVRRTRQVTRYRNGDAFTTTQVYYERVNSHTAGCAFNFSSCGVKDASKCVTGLENYPATKIRFTKSYSFANEDSFYEYETQRNQFFHENERRDDYMETREGMDLLNVNFKEYMIAFKDPDNLPWYVSHVIFWIASSLLLSWPLRVIIEYKTAYIHYHVQKVFGTNYTESLPQVHGRIPRDTTIASVDLERNIRNNFTVVPSYSEALLMDANATSTHTLRDANANVTSPILGPTRSVTWNNLSRSLSHGYVRGSFTAANTPNMPHSFTTANGELVFQNGSTESNSLSNSIKNVFQSPWTRRKKRNQNRQAQQKMFMLASPESPDDCQISVDQRLSSAAFKSGSNNGTRPKQTCSTSEQPDGARQSTSFADDIHSQLDRCSFDENSKVMRKSENHGQNAHVCSTESKPNPAFSSTTHVLNKSDRPTSISVNNNNLPSYGAEGEKLPIKGVLPKVNVQISTIIPDSPSDESSTENADSRERLQLPNSISQVITPSSPPSYEDALRMHMPDMANNAQSDNVSERTRLNDVNQRSFRHYSAIMETSL